MTGSREDKLAMRPEIAARERAHPEEGWLTMRLRCPRNVADLIQDQLATITDLGIVGGRRLEFLVGPLLTRNEIARFRAGGEAASS